MRRIDCGIEVTIHRPFGVRLSGWLMMILLFTGWPSHAARAQTAARPLDGRNDAQNATAAPERGPDSAASTVEKVQQDGETASQAAEDTSPAPQRKMPETPKTAVPLNKKHTVLLDRPGKRLWLRAHVVLRDGILEMLLCKKQTKEHESILAVDSQASVIHAGLLGLELTPGKPVQFVPEFQAPQGPVIDIFVTWFDAEGNKQRVSAKKWIRTSTRRYYVHKLAQLPAGLRLPDDDGLRYDEKLEELYWYGTMSAEQRDRLLQLSDDAAYQKIVKAMYRDSQPRAMDADWVFAGSGFFVDEKTGERYYQAESGDVICVANFSSATLDVAMRSTATGETELLFEANPEQVPPLGTPVLVELVPRAKPEGTPPADAGDTPHRPTQSDAASSDAAADDTKP